MQRAAVGTGQLRSAVPRGRSAAGHRRMARNEEPEGVRRSARYGAHAAATGRRCVKIRCVGYNARNASRNFKTFVSFTEKNKFEARKEAEAERESLRDEVLDPAEEDVKKPEDDVEKPDVEEVKEESKDAEEVKEDVKMESKDEAKEETS